MCVNRSGNPRLAVGLMVLAGLIFIAWASADAGAQTFAGTAAPLSSAAASLAGNSAPAGPVYSFMKVLGGLGVILSLIIFGFFGARKYAPQYFAKNSGGKSLQLIETLTMGERRSIALVDVCGKRMLLGNSGQQITLLAKLDEPVVPDSQSVAAVPKSAIPAKNPQTSFRSLLEVAKRRDVVVPDKIRPIAPDVRAKMRQLRETLEK
jgi:flagellar biogenesis protein FliO